MNTTITTTPLTDLPVINSPLDPDVADGLGDSALLSATADTKVQKVRRTTNRSSAPVSGVSRAWTMGGNVD